MQWPAESISVRLAVALQRLHGQTRLTRSEVGRSGHIAASINDTEGSVRLLATECPGLPLVISPNVKADLFVPQVELRCRSAGDPSLRSTRMTHLHTQPITLLYPLLVHARSRRSTLRQNPLDPQTLLHLSSVRVVRILARLSAQGSRSDACSLFKLKDENRTCASQKRQLRLFVLLFKQEAHS